MNSISESMRLISKDRWRDMNNLYKFLKVDFVIVLSAFLFLSACGGGGSGESSGTTSENSAQSTNEDIITLHGSVGDGPIVGATVQVFDKDNHLLTERSSDNTANYQLSVLVSRNAYPLILEASGGMDIVTGGQPDFTLKSIVLTPSAKKQANINPFSTMIVEMATNMPGGTTATNVASAKQVVLQQMNFGFHQAVMPDPIASEINQTNIGTIVRSSEALGEMVRRTRDALQVTEPGITADQVISALSADLIDGVIDGAGATNADARVAAVSNITSAQVLVEVIAGALYVNNADSSDAMYNAVRVSMPNITPGTSVNDLPIVGEMMTQTIAMLSAAQAIDANPLFVETKNALSNHLAGAQRADVVATLPANVSTNLKTTLTNVAVASEATLEEINAAARSGSPETDIVNAAPSISGNPLGTVEENTPYHFAPSASDADGDSLNFSISNLPVWASFNSSTGVISGQPTSANAGTYNDIVISVSDAKSSVALSAFSIVVTSAPNTTPMISGTPAFMVTTNEMYSFVPTASDIDGDRLTFTVPNLPNWASFTPATGRISGTPSIQNVGVWSAIVITVTDGMASASLPAFSITVNGTPNTAPTISGTPSTTVTENAAYSFIPTANDIDGDTLSFSVSNLPAWASFNATNGALTGTPDTLDVGVSGSIVITVSDGTTNASLPAFSITVNSAPNTAPTISGTPSTTVTENAAYSFVPTTNDIDGDTLSFSVSNLPAWASFNATTGALTGTPGNLDVGVSGSMIITVSDGVASTSLPAFSINVTAATTSFGTATLSWLPPTENTDGSVLTDLAGYKIYYGTESGNYTSTITIDNPGIATYVVDNLPGGNTYYFVITSFTTGGLESEYSTMGSKTIL